VVKQILIRRQKTKKKVVKKTKAKQKTKSWNQKKVINKKIVAKKKALAKAKLKLKKLRLAKKKTASKKKTLQKKVTVESLLTKKDIKHMEEKSMATVTVKIQGEKFMVPKSRLVPRGTTIVRASEGQVTGMKAIGSG